MRSFAALQRGGYPARDDRKAALCLGHQNGTRFRSWRFFSFWIYCWIYKRAIVSDTSQERALKNYRKRLRERGLARFEVLGLDADRKLIRSLARRLAEDGPTAKRLRATVNRTLSGRSPKKGGILAALRRSPLVGADLDVTRVVTRGRKIDL
jgi:hypothetical protein